VDVQNRVSSLIEWVVASEGTRANLDMRVKQPRCLLFYIGCVYEFRFNEDGKFSQAQLCILLVLPSESDLNFFKKIKVMVSPPGLK
jgi:hypothetical protein